MELQGLVDRLSRLSPVDQPVISIYLDARPGPEGRDQFQSFARNELTARVRTYPQRGVERAGLERDVERILVYARDEMRRETNAVAVFACEGAGLFEAVQLEVPIDRSHVHVGPRPHLYPLAHVLEHYRRYAAVLLDTHVARVVVFALGEVVRTAEVENEKTHRTDLGGWSQARYQRHVDAIRERHVKEVVAELDRIVREEGIDRIVVGGDEVVVPMLREALPKPLATKLVGVRPLDIRTADDTLLERTLDAIVERDARDDREKVERLLAAYRAGGLGVAGLEATLAALDNGQVYDLVLTATGDALGGHGDELVARARRTGATVTFVEDPALLADVEGVGGLLRFRIGGLRAAA